MIYAINKARISFHILIELQAIRTYKYIARSDVTLCIYKLYGWWRHHRSNIKIIFITNIWECYLMTATIEWYDVEKKTLNLSSFIDTWHAFKIFICDHTLSSERGKWNFYVNNVGLKWWWCISLKSS